MHKSKNIVHINTKAKRSQTSCFQEVWPFYSLTSVKDGIIAEMNKNSEYHLFQSSSYCLYVQASVLRFQAL